MDFVARGCAPYGKAPFFNPTHDQRCANKAYCMNSEVNCYFIDKTELQKHKGNWKDLVAAGEQMQTLFFKKNSKPDKTH